MVEAEYVSTQLAAVADPVFLLETLFGEAPVAFALYHVDGQCRVANRAFRELFGSVPPLDYNIFKDELLTGLGLMPEIRRAFAGEPVALPAAWYDAGKLAHVQVAAKRVAIEASMTPLKDRDGAVRHVAASYKDVTAAHLLEAERRVLRKLFEIAPEAILIYDLDTGRIDDANDNAVRLFGYPRDQLLARTPGELSPERQPDGRLSSDAIGDNLLRARRGERLVLEWTHRTATGDPIPCEIRVVYLPDEGRALCRVSIVDLRERRQIEAERERSRSLHEQNLRIHEANRLKSEFLAAMSHELRTPLNTIIGFSELLYYGRVARESPEHQEFLGDILTSSRHLLQLINDVLDLAKVEAGKLEFRPEPVVLEAVISEVTGLLRTMALQKRIRVTVAVDRSIETVVIDPARFKQVLYNYLSNALKFTPDGGAITVRTSPEPPDAFRLEVEDTGVGIAADQISRLFLEFEQLEPARGGGAQGTGLGLALTRRIVEAQGGSVGVRSQPGQGSVFHAILPRETSAIPAR